MPRIRVVALEGSGGDNSPSAVVDAIAAATSAKTDHYLRWLIKQCKIFSRGDVWMPATINSN